MSMKGTLSTALEAINAYRAATHVDAKPARAREPLATARKGASAKVLAELEARLGRPLPPSYRKLLLAADGVDNIEPAFGLLASRDVLRALDRKTFAKWHAHVAKYRRDHDPDAILVIGSSATVKSKLVLLVPKGKAAGEWRVALRSADSDLKYPSVAAYLETTARAYRQRLSQLEASRTLKKQKETAATTAACRLWGPLLDRGVAVRNRYFDEDDDPRSALRSGASDAEIKTLERKIGRTLPQSYRDFLSLSNGWDSFDATVTLLSAKQAGDAYALKKFTRWYREMGFAELGYPDPSQTVVIGSSAITAAKYLLVLPRPVRGRFPTEWKVMFVDSGVERIYPSFLELVKRTEAVYAKLGGKPASRPRT